MNTALLRKAIREAGWLLAGCLIVSFLFQWIRVWMISMLPMAKFAAILQLLPSSWTSAIPIPMDQIISMAGRIGMGFEEPAVLLVASIWAIARGSDAVSGEIGRGTMEMLLTQPVRRGELLFWQAVVTIAGALLIAAANWMGILVGTSVLTMEENVAVTRFIAPAVNTFAMTLFLAGLATFLSSIDRYRWRTIGIMGGFILVEMIVDMVSMISADYRWLANATYFSLYEPARLATSPDGRDTLVQCGLLTCMGVAAYVAALAVFRRRDIPAPL
jgi:ABC-2 type transport system permease protein